MSQNQILQHVKLVESMKSSVLSTDVLATQKVAKGWLSWLNEFLIHQSNCPKKKAMPKQLWQSGLSTVL